MPSIRAKCAREFERQLQAREKTEDTSVLEFLKYFPELDKDLKLIYELILPMGTSYEPLPDAEDLSELRKRSRNLSIEKNYEVNEMDMRDCTADEIYSKLEPETRAFFDNYPIELPQDKKMRVTKVISSWVGYMSEVCLCV